MSIERLKISIIVIYSGKTIHSKQFITTFNREFKPSFFLK
nr:MAG TPA: hypothetical protein [Caudoviricetes sp.]